MNIAFDIDGVFTDFEKFLNFFGTKYMSNKVILKEYPVEYSLSFAKQYECSKEQERKFYERYLLWYSKNFPMRENVAGVIHQLRRQGRLLVREECEFSGYGEIIRKLGIIFVKRENKISRKKLIQL